MKKVRLTLLSFSAALILIFILASCDGSHTHSYTQKNADVKYLTSNASCVDENEYYYSCSCGEAGEEKFTAPPIPHTVQDGKCTRCSLPESSSGLHFALNPDESSYRVMGIGSCTDQDIVIGIYNNMSVTSISKEAFAHSLATTSVTVADCVNSIGEGAFYACVNLTEVTLPKSIKSIPKQAFAHCTRLTNVSLPDSVTAIGKEAFADCSDLVSLSIGTGLKSISTDAFKNCYKLVEVINKSQMQIAAGAENYGGVGYYAKEIHSGDSKIHLTDNFLFYTHGGVNYLVGYVGTERNVILPDDYNGEGYEIYSRAFYNRYEFTSVTIGKHTTNIGWFAFEECPSLFEVINKSQLKLSSHPSLDNSVCCIYGGREIHTGESKIDIIDGYVFYTYDNVNYLLDYVGTETDITLPDTYNGKPYEIYKYAFYRDYKITSVKVPNSITFIPEYAFTWCVNLVSVDLGDGVTDICQNAFAQCQNLAEVKLSASLERIWHYAFYYCKSLDNVSIPRATTHIYFYAFAYCENLSSVTFEKADRWRTNVSFVSFSENELSNKSTAAKYLSNTHSTSWWMQE